MSTNWTFTPKLLLTASASRTISPPTTAIANAQESYGAGQNLTYQLTPKVAVIARAVDRPFYLIIHSDEGGSRDFPFFL